MGKNSTIDKFFKKRDSKHLDNNWSTSNQPSETNLEAQAPNPEQRHSKAPRVESGKVNISRLERDPGLRQPIWTYHVNQQDDIRRAYITDGPYQPILSEYPLSNNKHPRRFQASWFTLFPNWLEYSPTKDAAFCLPCYLFHTPSGRPGSSAFIVEGFQSWKKVNSGEKCAFLTHVGKDPNTTHKNAVRHSDILMNQPQHIDKVWDKKNSLEIANNRLRLQVSIDVAKWLTFQASAFRGHDERPSSKNRGNFLEMVKFLASYNKEVGAVVLENAPQNATYVSHRTQKEILQIFSRRIQKFIREEIADSKFCIIVDEARDESKKEQMAIVLRFVDKDGFIRERFFDVVHVSDTSAQTLKIEISNVLSRHDLSIQSIRGQGYDGASNMRGEWNGLQALFSSECPYAYYIHCFAHRLQLVLVVASREVIPVHKFFNKLIHIVNTTGSSCKRQDQLRDSQAEYIANMIAIDELETGKGLNQIGTVKRAGDTRWGSHLSSIRSLMNMFAATLDVLRGIIADGKTYVQRGDADAAYDTMTSYEFVFILHLLRDTMEITDDLCQALQNKSQDIVNAMYLVSSTKRLIQKMRDEEGDSLFDKVKQFCEKYGIAIPDMNARYTAGRGRFRHQRDEIITMKHYYRFDVFTATIDSQLSELNHRFKEDVVELLVLSMSLDPRENYRLFDIEKIMKLAFNFYPEDFSEQDKLHLKYQLQLFELDIHQHPELQNLSSMSQLCQALEKTKKSKIYPLVDRLVRLVLTLPVSTATTERAFSAMSLVKTKLRNKMGDEFLGNCLITYIEKEIAGTFDTDSIIDEFYSMKDRRVPLKA